MCTVVVAVQPGAPWPVVFLGLRDESPDRPWDEPGAWWPELGDRVTGVHDREAGGAWLATARGPSRASVVSTATRLPSRPRAAGRHAGPCRSGPPPTARFPRARRRPAPSTCSPRTREARCTPCGTAPSPRRPASSPACTC
ncbi:NRDE family protein [Frigoribacterium sp. VKM Ac-1396]|uniref:NRDE family protein n=1 Tax=Frigoribacterium sp. VKM Ac-1396 TaxID=2783821 RepID=UPI00351CA6BF